MSPRRRIRKLRYDSDDEVANEFYSTLETKREDSRKSEKKLTLKSPSPPVYITRSGRKTVKKFAKLSLENETAEDSDSSEDEPVLPESEKPTVLYDDDKAIEGEIFGFQTPKRKHSMIAKASDSVSKTQRTPATPKTTKGVKETPKRTPRATKETLKNGMTPRATRSSLKARIKREATRQKCPVDESDDSEYQPTDSSSAESTSSDEEDVVPLEDGEESDTCQKKPLPPPPIESSRVTRRRQPRCSDVNFVFTSDNYFERQGSKSVTSDHNLNRLKNPRLQHDEMMALLKDVDPRHKRALQDVDAENRSTFRRWLFAMGQGFNVLLYGVGSKRTLLNSFHAQHLSAVPTLVVNGFFPGVTLKEILDSLAEGVLKMKKIPPSPAELLEAVDAKLRSPKAADVFVLVHNLDGPPLRAEKTQAALARLAAIPKIHIVASIDHINSPLLWDQNKLSQYNFVWEDATTFLPYFEETSYESSMMVQRSGTLALQALRNIFQSLNVNAKKVFRLLMDHQLKNGGKHYQGILFSDLYRSCRNEFIVSSDLALRTQLTEFFDHKLVRHKKETDHLVISVEPEVLRQFNEENILNE
ncbi:unnamed protein product [Nesidiocoris tenuis]|uniref:Origin recognition complex subunit n=2 Tax=Nesidiocoris tenuis TaxID=355587 RepID=A0ABN7B6C0_9HEMI|nr:Origin recognition complex subunit [Nesidiocoris tenuis]CAB0002990.1 unnamed protein product [Nesidiocoris tenuis]